MPSAGGSGFSTNSSSPAPAARAPAGGADGSRVVLPVVRMSR
jgi:hypothetical protein